MKIPSFMWVNDNFISGVLQEDVYRPVNYAAQKIGVSQFAVYKRVQRNTIEHVLVDGYAMIPEIVIDYEIAKKQHHENFEVVEISFDDKVSIVPLFSDALSKLMIIKKKGSWKLLNYQHQMWNKKINPLEFHRLKDGTVLQVVYHSYAEWYVRKFKKNLFEDVNGLIVEFYKKYSIGDALLIFKQTSGCFHKFINVESIKKVIDATQKGYNIS